MSQEKVGLKIVDLLHDITQEWYHVKFCDDFNSMIRIEYYSENDDSFYKHEHLGFPGCERIRLEKDIIESLSKFLTDIRENKENEKV